MTARPPALGLDVEINSFDDVDPILHELAWLNNEKARIDAIVREKIDAITKEYEHKYSFRIGREVVTFAQRYETLEKILSDWTLDHVKEHLKGKKKSVSVAHGSIGLRQIPLVVKLAEETSEETVLDAIDEDADGIITLIRGWGVKKLKSFGCLVGDVLKIEASLNLAGIKKAFETNRLSRTQIEGIGLAIREAEDKPDVKPSQLVVSTE